MNMQPNDDERFEDFLRQFRPRRPRALTIPEEKVAWMRRPWAFAASVLLVAGAAAWAVYSFQNRFSDDHSRIVGQAQPRQADLTRTVAVGRLTRLMLEDPAKADAELDKVSSQLLPDVRRSKGALGALAAE